MSLNQMDTVVSIGFSWLRVWLQIAFTYLTPLQNINISCTQKLKIPHGVVQILLWARLVQSTPLYPISLRSTATFTYAYEFQFLFPSSFSTTISCAILVSPIREPRS